MALVGADVEALRALARTLSQAAERLEAMTSSLNGALSRVQWVGQDAERFRADWQQLSRAQVTAAATALRDAAQALQRNALEQEQASAATAGVSGVFAGSPSSLPPPMPPLPFTASPGLLDPFVDGRDFLNQTPIWPITWGTLLSGAGVDGLSLVDALGLAGDTRLDDGEKIIQAGNSATDLIGGLLKGSDTPVGYLAGVATQQWGDVFANAARDDFSPAGIKTVTDYIAQDPGGAFDAAKDAVVGYLPKLFSNLVPW